MQMNSHHIWFERRHYQKNGLLTRLRNHHGFILPMSIYDHRELHRDLLPVPRPAYEDAEGLLDYLGTYDSQAERIDYLDLAIGFLAVRSPITADHLRQQRGYVLLTPVTQVERDIVEQERLLGGAA